MTARAYERGWPIEWATDRWYTATLGNQRTGKGHAFVAAVHLQPKDTMLASELYPE